MKKKKEDISIISKGLSYKLKISFYLMIVLPVLVCLYLVSTYIVPVIGIKPDIIMAVIASICIAVIGFLLIKEVFLRILSICTEAKMIAAGDLNRKITPGHKDEVGDLGIALNQLTNRIRANMDELKSYGEKTSEINLEIQKRVLVLSSLLQISSLVSQGAKLDDILDVAIEKSRLLASSDAAYLLFRQDGDEIFKARVVDSPAALGLTKLSLEPKDLIYPRFIKSVKPLILDKENTLPDNVRQEINTKLGLSNILAIPIFLKGKPVAIMGVGNSRKDFVYSKDDIELLDIFAKQIAIAVENDLLIRRVEKLEIKDVLTGLYNEGFIRGRLQEEIQRAITYQRPCAFVLLEIDNFQKFQDKYGLLAAEFALKKVGALIKDSVLEIERVARFADNEFAIVLPEKNKRQTKEVAEKIRKKIELAFSEEQEEEKKLTICGSVSENPLDGINSDELIAKAKHLLANAKSEGKNRIVI